MNRVNYKDSRCILSEGDLLGFGCNTITKHNKNKNDRKYYVYRIALGSGFDNVELIELSDSSGEDENQSFGQPNNSFQDGNVTDDECPSADEMDVKPDIHSLMRMTYSKMQIKEEIEWNCYEYDKEQNKRESPSETVETFCLLDCSQSSEDDIVSLEPPQKRKRQADNFDYFAQCEDIRTKPNNKPTEIGATEIPLNGSILNQTIEPVPEYQMSETTLKEKVKIVVRSRGAQLASDMLMSKDELLNHLNEPSTSTQTPKSNKMIIPEQKLQEIAFPITSSSNVQNYEHQHDEMSIDNLTNDFISEVTKWDFRWISDQKPNPLRYKMDVRPLDTNFSDLDSFQRCGKHFLILWHILI